MMGESGKLLTESYRSPDSGASKWKIHLGWDFRNELYNKEAGESHSRSIVIEGKWAAGQADRWFVKEPVGHVEVNPLPLGTSGSLEVGSGKIKFLFHTGWGFHVHACDVI